MTLSDLSLRRPVFATVLNLLIILIGAVALSRLPIRELPQIEAATVTVRVTYTGASPDVVDSQIASVVEGALAGISGLDSISTKSERGRMRSVLTFDPSRDIDAAANDVRTAVDRITESLPDAASAPLVEKNDDEGDPVVRLALSSDSMTPMQLSEYADRYLTDRFARLPGVANAAIYGERALSMRIWLDVGRMAAHGITPADITSSLSANNIELPAGELRTSARQLQLLARTRFSSVEEFERLVIRDDGPRPLRLGDVARIEEGPGGNDVIFRNNGVVGLGLGIQPQAQANTVAISKAVHEELERLRPTLPEGMVLRTTVDEAVFIENTMRQMLHVFTEAVVLVTAVIFLFLGSARLSMIPIVTIPISILGAAAAMLALGFTLNILTLFAMILAIGLVVDDAIVVLENIQRLRATGLSRAEAARQGASQVSFAVIASTAVLIAVFLPVSFMQGEIGKLFREFGIVLAVSVAVSGFVALTLSPVLAARLMPRAQRPGLLTRGVDRVVEAAEHAYRATLLRVLRAPEILLAVTAFLVAASAALYLSLPQEVTPEEDRGGMIISLTTPQGTNLDQTDAATRKVEALLEPLRQQGVITNVTTVVGTRGELRRSILIVTLAPWTEREMTVQQVVEELRGPLRGLTEVQSFLRPTGGLGIGSGRGSLRFMLGGPDVQTAANWAEDLAAAMAGDPDLGPLQVGYSANQPGAVLKVDRPRAQDLGLDAQVVAQTLQALIASREIGEFSRDGRQYPVILQAEDADRDSPDDLRSVLIRNNRGDLIPLSSIASIETEAMVPAISRQDRVHSVDVEADLAEGADLAAVMARVEAKVQTLPAGAILTWQGQAKNFLSASGGMTMVFGMALAIVFLVLAAQFESFRTPLVIMLTVPLGMAGAIVTLWAFGQSVNIYSQVGLVLLVGLMAKNGILMVEFANQLREGGKPLREAAIEGAVTRLRPVTMTSIATVLGALPLAMATGAGAESRQAIGMVVAGGLTVAFVLTLIVTPVIYVLVEGARRHPAEDGEEARA